MQSAWPRISMTRLSWTRGWKTPSGISRSLFHPKTLHGWPTHWWRRSQRSTCRRWASPIRNTYWCAISTSPIRTAIWSTTGSEMTGKLFRTRTSRSETPRYAESWPRSTGYTLRRERTTCGGSGCANPTRPDTKSTMRSKGVCPDAPDGKGWRSN